MPRYDDSVIQQVISQSDIVSVISERTVLTKKGRTYTGCCPFHSEKTPSFHVDPDKKLYHCFGCGVGGTVITYVMNNENVRFNEAIEILAERFHIPLPQKDMTPQEQQRLKRRAKFFNINKEAANYYYKALHGKYGEKGMNYFKGKRNLGDEVMNNFGLGYSPLEGNFLIRNLKEKGFTETDMENAGLILKSQKGNYYDKFFGRVIFPIQDVNDNVIGFTARKIEGDEKITKYLNTPETEVFHKKESLYALNKAKKSRRDGIILVEGNMDVVSLHEQGFDNVCATCGTAIGPEQAKLLRKYTQNMILIYDSDDAGINAAFRAIPILRDAGINVKVLNVTDAKDPDEYIKKFGKEKFDELLKTAKGYIEFELDTMIKKYNLNETSDRKEFIDKSLERIKVIKDEVDKDSYISKLSDYARIDTNILIRKLNGEKEVKVVKKEEVKNDTNTRTQESIKKELEQKQLISILLNDDKALSNKLTKYLTPEKMETEFLQTLLKDIYDTREKEETLDIASFINHYEEAKDQAEITNIYTIMKKAETDKRKTLAIQILREEKRREIETEIQNINTKFKTASSEEQIELGLKLSELTKSLQAINKWDPFDPDGIKKEIRKKDDGGFFDE